MKNWPLLVILIAVCVVAWLAPSAMAASSTTDMQMKNGKTIVSTDTAYNYSPPGYATLADHNTLDYKTTIIWAYGKDQAPMAGASIITSGKTANETVFASVIMANLGNAQTEVSQDSTIYCALKTNDADVYGDTKYAWVALNDSSGGGNVNSQATEIITDTHNGYVVLT